MAKTAFTSAAKPDEMSLHDVYVGSLAQKKGLADTTLARAIDIYDAHKAGGQSRYLVSNAPTAALETFVSGLDAALAEKGIDRTADPKGFSKAVKEAYRSMIEAHGVERVNPAERGGVSKYNEWFKVYNKSFPIRGERETKSDMRDLLSEPMTKKGYGEIAIGLKDPLQGRYVGGVQGLVVAEASAGMFTYAFLDAAYQGFGLSHTLLDSLRGEVKQTVKKHFPNDKRNVEIFLEKNKLSNMPLENIFLDSTGVSVDKLPVKGQSLVSGAISQSQRDGTWSKLGAKEIEDASYIQPSLDGVTSIKDPVLRALVIRALQGDRTLTENQRKTAAKGIHTALAGKAAHCPLALCVFVDKGQTSVDLKQTQQFLNAFLGTSCLDTNAKGLKDDIFAQATLGKIEKQADAKGQLPLISVDPFGGPIPVRNFAEAEKVTRALLQVVPKDEVRKAAKIAAQGGQETSYGQWLERYQGQIQMVLKQDPGLRKTA